MIDVARALLSSRSMKASSLLGGSCVMVLAALGVHAACNSASAAPQAAEAPKEPAPDPNALGPKDESLAPLLRTSPLLSPLLDKASALRLQVLVSAVREPAPGAVPPVATLIRSGYRVDAEYFYPASSIKLAAAVGALEKLGTLRKNGGEGASVDAPLRFFAGSGMPPQERDGSNLDGGRITLGHEVKKALIVSNNDAFNRLLDFAGYDELAGRMAGDGFSSVRIRHYLGAAPSLAGDARQNPRIQIVAAEGQAPIEIEARQSTRALGESDVPGLTVGSAYLDDKGQKVDGPMEFSQKNRISLRDLQDMLIGVVRPDLLADRKTALDEPERVFLTAVLGTPPSASKNPSFDAESQPDSLHRPLLVAVRKAMPGHRIRSYEKNGQAYAFVVQNTYLVDETTHRSVFVSATAYVNGNGTMNLDQYRYDDVTQPLFDGLADVIAHQFLN